MNIVKIHSVLALFLLVFASCQNTPIRARKAELNPKIESNVNETKQLKTESPEEKAVRIAEKFVKQNGYTDLPADKNNLSHETIEYYESIDELLKQRHNTLKPKAYGILYRGRLGDEKGWTIVFQYSDKIIDELEKLPKSNPISNSKLIGRAVTMNEKFENLLLEHKVIFLEKVSKKF